MARPRKQTYTLKMYLDKIKDGDICNDADVQRNFVWKKEQINELIVTVLTDDYIPPIILGEEDNTQLHIADGGQRSAALKLFRSGNYKITSSIEDSIISYKKKVKDENGNIVWEDAEFDIKNKTYEQLPCELKKKFNEYQIETVIHENCDRYKISKYIKRYNNVSPMNAAQRAFTYAYNYAEYVHKILGGRFFIEHSAYTEAEKIKGVVERIIMESVMCMFHLDDWKKQAKQIASYLNENSSKEEFEKLDDNLHRLENIITDDIKDIFNSKDTFIWLTLFNRFTEIGLEDHRFADFLVAFKHGLRYETVGGELFDEVDKGKGTKDKAVILSKLHILEILMHEFLLINKEDLEEVDVLGFVRENVNPETTEKDIEFYADILNDLTLEVDNNTRLLDERNRPSLIALVGYACEKDTDLDEWVKQWFATNDTYEINAKQNYLHMKEDLDKYIRIKNKNTEVA